MSFGNLPRMCSGQQSNFFSIAVVTAPAEARLRRARAVSFVPYSALRPRGNA
jgi:hypothetical protein